MHKQSSYGSINTTERERLAVGLARLHIQYTQRYPCTPHANKYEHAHSMSERRKERAKIKIERVFSYMNLEFGAIVARSFLFSN